MKIINVMSILIVVFLAASTFAARTTTLDTSSGSYVDVTLINQDPDPAVAGDILELRLGVENSGGESIDDLMLETDLEYPFSILPGTSTVQEVGSLTAYQEDDDMKIVKFKVLVDQNANAGMYDINLNYYTKGSTAKNQETISIDLENQENVEILYIDKTVLIPGKETDVTFTINNVGSAPLRDLTFSWENPDKVILPVGGDNTKYVQSIDVGGQAQVTYKVIADSSVDAGLYELSLTLKYDDALTGSSSSLKTTAGMYVGGETDFDIAFSETSNGETSFTVANIGSNPAYSVSVSVPEQSGVSTTGTNTVIIGNLNNGDYTVVSYGLNTGRATSVRLDVTYTDTRGERLTVTKDVSLGGSTSATGETGTITLPDGTTRTPGQRKSPMGNTNGITTMITYAKYAGVAILVLIIGFVVYKIRKGKRRRK